MTNVTKAVKPSIKSTLAANDVEALAAVLVKAGDKATVQKMGLTFSLAVKKAVELIKAEEKRQETEKAERQAAIEAANKAKQTEAENMLKHLTEELGLDLAVAGDMVEVAMLKKYGEEKKEKEPKTPGVKSFTFNRVTIDFDGEKYDMPTSGNMPTAWKERVESEFGSDRTAFILKYAVDQEAAKEITAQKNGVNA